MNHSCSLCGANTNQPTCAKCWKAYVDDLHSLFAMLPQVERISRREERIGGRQQGHSNPAFASAPVDLPALDLLTEASEVLEDVAGHCNLWAGSWRSIVKKMIARRTQVTQSKQLVADWNRVSHLVSKVELRLTPPAERLIIGQCLNPTCLHELNAVKDQSEVVCPACGSVWQVEAVRQKRREKLSTHTLEATQGEASRWLKRKTGVYVERHAIAMWLQRNMLPNSRKLGDGVYEFNIGELLLLAETYVPRDRLRHSRM